VYFTALHISLVCCRNLEGVPWESSVIKLVAGSVVSGIFTYLRTYLYVSMVVTAC
jgi:hypothetical protein